MVLHVTRSGFCVDDTDVGDEKENLAAFLGLGECGPVLTDVFGAVPVALGDSSAPAPSIRVVSGGAPVASGDFPAPASHKLGAALGSSSRALLRFSMLRTSWMLWRRVVLIVKHALSVLVKLSGDGRR